MNISEIASEIKITPNFGYDGQSPRRLKLLELHRRYYSAQMCEWLSYGEWCDVQLVCGGRAFSAHRAVLASVSNFLKRLLLSCPTDESPTFIVLPDFDLDAMSSVLYYIYNGEVMIRKEKIEMFLDIIKAMQIFIDSQYLPQISDKIDFKSFSHTELDITKQNTFTLGLSNSRDLRYINLKRGNEIQSKLLQYSANNPDRKDKLVRTQNSSGEPTPSLGDLKSSYGDRQRHSFLRDLYIETYPRNGNVNGLKAGVLAISNECYRAPASALSSNANGKHLDDALFERFQKTSEPITCTNTEFHLREQRNFVKTFKSYTPSCLSANSAENNNNKQFCDNLIPPGPKNTWMNHSPASNVYNLGLGKQILTQFYVPSIDIKLSPTMVDSVKSLQMFRNNSKIVDNVTSNTDSQKNSSSSSRVTILNHVLESPWSPRIPNNFKPFRRKLIENETSSDIIAQKNKANIPNDDNNNVENLIKIKPDILEELKESTPVSDEKLMAISPTATQSDDLKCNVCYQMFTSNELLAAHMRRHSTNVRYSCNECSKTFSQLRNFKYHMSIHRGTREFAATCSVCGKYFNDRGYLSSHMKIHRNRKEYKCTLCPKSFNQRVAYNMHVRIHTGVKPHVCSECGKAFSRKMLLKQHSRTHSGERPYACPHCDKRFADRSNMTLHLRLHTGVKPFSCTLCPKSFTKKHHLKSHLNFHTGSKPYSCPRCSLAFTQSSNMRTHLKKCRAPEPGTKPNTLQN